MRMPTARVCSLKSVGDTHKEITVRKIITASILVVATTAFPLSALGQSTNSSVTPSISRMNFKISQNLNDCIYSDVKQSSSKAIRACSKAYKAAIPRRDIKSQILMRRGLLQLSAGRFDKASQDFNRASKLNGETELTSLGQGYIALMQQNYVAATEYFNDCNTNKNAAPIALYGLAMVKENSGDLKGAVETYKAASNMYPTWQAPRKELARLKAKV